MKDRTVFIARHGNRADFVDRAWGRTARYPDDPPLSEDGRLQARELGARLSGAGVDRILCSPFLRTVQTACLVAEILDRTVNIERGLSEWLNPAWFEAYPVLTPREELEHACPRVDWSVPSVLTPAYPETEEDVKGRVKRTVRALLERHDGTLLLVGHGASVDAAARALAGDGLVVNSSLCSLTQIVGTDGAWRVVLNGDTGHLSRPEGAEAGWAAGPLRPPSE